MSKKSKFKKLKKLNNVVAKRVVALELMLSRFEDVMGLIAGGGVFASIGLVGSFPAGQTGTIRPEPGGDGCQTVVKTSVSYKFDSERIIRSADGNTERFVTYEITITTVVTQEGCPPGTNPIAPRTTTHKFKKTFGPGQSDKMSSGSTTGFDGVETDTLTIEHGTKVKVERGKPAGKTTVTVTYQDGTSVSTVVP